MSSDCKGRTQREIGKDIENWRMKKTTLSQEDLALMLGLNGDRQYRRICVECKYEFSLKQIRLLAKLMNVSTDYLIPDADFEEDPKYIENVIKKDSTYSQDKLEEIVIENLEVCLSEADHRIMTYATEIINMKEEELKEDIADQMESTLKIAKRALKRIS